MRLVSVDELAGRSDEVVQGVIELVQAWCQILNTHSEILLGLLVAYGQVNGGHR